MAQYRVFHREKIKFWDGLAPTALDACRQAGWPITDCWVRELTPAVKDPKSESGSRGGGWKNVTPRELK